MRVDKSSMPNESESFNSYQLSSSFGRGLTISHYNKVIALFEKQLHVLASGVLANDKLKQ